MMLRYINVKALALCTKQALLLLDLRPILSLNMAFQLRLAKTERKKSV